MTGVACIAGLASAERVGEADTGCTGEAIATGVTSGAIREDSGEANTGCASLARGTLVVGLADGKIFRNTNTESANLTGSTFSSSATVSQSRGQTDARNTSLASRAVAVSNSAGR